MAADCLLSSAGLEGGAVFSGLGSVTSMLTSVESIGSEAGSGAGRCFFRRLPQRLLNASLISRCKVFRESVVALGGSELRFVGRLGTSSSG